MRVLYLHVWHGKTGSSYLQSMLALSKEALSDNGIAYLLNEGGKRAARGKIISGNGNLLEGFLKGHRDEVGEKGELDCLFSSEVGGLNDQVHIWSPPGLQVLRLKKGTGWLSYIRPVVEA